jgi:hypothetical protein
MGDIIETEMRRILRRNLLKYAVGRAICCPDCEAILDVRRAILFASHVICDRCFETAIAPQRTKRGAATVDAYLASATAAGDMIDGRVLYPQVATR